MKCIFVAAALLALLPTSASAEGRRSEVRVSHVDLDLTTAMGVRSLDRRINAAAEAVCPDIRGASELALRLHAKRCIASAVSNVKPQRDRIIAARTMTWKLAQRTP